MIMSRVPCRSSLRFEDFSGAMTVGFYPNEGRRSTLAKVSRRRTPGGICGGAEEELG
jgi:hypothetical protein